MNYMRRPVSFNPHARTWVASPAESGESVLNFHRQLLGYEQTRLVSLPEVAREMGIGQVWLKDESVRLGLPSFKILGASWGTWRALVNKLDLYPSADIESVKEALGSQKITRK
jgi:threonine dehydratase